MASSTLHGNVERPKVPNKKMKNKMDRSITAV